MTTTTHMAYEPERPFVEDGDIDGVWKDLQRYHYTVAASLDRATEKIGCLSEEKLEELRGLADVLLIEADGAKRLPLKVPGEREPVIPEFAEMVIGVVGVDARRANPEDLPQTGESCGFPWKRDGRSGYRG